MGVAPDERELDDMGGTDLATRRAQVLDAAHRCVDLLVRSADIGPDGVPTWTAGRRSLQHGDAGVVWALTHLGTALNRPDAVELAASGGRALVRSRPEADPPSGLLGGEAGVDLLGRGRRATLGWSEASDVADGLAGILLSLSLVRRAEDHATAVVEELWRRSHVEARGRSWRAPAGVARAGRPPRGLARGALGIGWALVEAAAVWHSVAPSALELAAEAFDWEASVAGATDGSAVEDAGSGTGPRTDPWCGGAAGDAAVRLRVLELVAAGLRVPWRVEETRCEAEAAVRRCWQEIDTATEELVRGGLPAEGGRWTLGDGLGAAVGALALAADVLERPELRDRALAGAGEYVARAPADPAFWRSGPIGPSGRGDASGDVGLVHGVAGTAVVLADLALPGAVPSAVLLGAGGMRGAHRRSTGSATPRQGPVVGRMRVV